MQKNLTRVVENENIHPQTSLDTWQQWREFTQARIALGRTGAALPTQQWLDFSLAHAMAKDAIHTQLNVETIQQELISNCWQVLLAQSQATDRATYLNNPDLGRTLHYLTAHDSSVFYDMAFVIGDGLSSLAVQKNAIPLLNHVRELLNPQLTIAPVVVATQARVALADAIGEKLNAKLVVMLIGERPGLSSPDSLGVYITFNPKVGRTDAERNCISNVRPDGLSYTAAAFKLNWLVEQAFKRGLTGVDLKDESDLALPHLKQTALKSN